MNSGRRFRHWPEFVPHKVRDLSPDFEPTRVEFEKLLTEQQEGDSKAPCPIKNANVLACNGDDPPLITGVIGQRFQHARQAAAEVAGV